MDDRIDADIIQTTSLARQRPPLPGGKKRDNGNQVYPARARRRRYRPKTDEPFAVRVKRKFNTAKAKLGRKLGLYSEGHLFPLGLYVDVLA